MNFLSISSTRHKDHDEGSHFYYCYTRRKIYHARDTDERTLGSGRKVARNDEVRRFPGAETTDETNEEQV